MSWSRDRWARVGLALLVTMWLAVAVFVPWRGVVIVDDRTFVEMAAGVRDHGLPYTTNTWSDRLPEAHPSFQIPRGDKLWGPYPPLYPYVLGLGLAIGGLASIYKLGALLMAALCVVLWRLGRHVFGDELAGTLAAFLASFGLPLVLGSIQTIAMPLAILVSAGALLSGVRALRERKWHLYASTGVLAGLAMATHLLEAGICGAICAVVVLGGQRDVRSLVRRGAATFLPLAIVLLPVAVLDHVRFGSYNPISYGPCVWWMCTHVLDNQLSTSSLLAWAMPGLLPVGLAGGGFYMLRRHPRGRLLWVGACLLPGLLIPLSRHRLAAMGGTLWGFFVDSSLLDLSSTSERFDSLGWSCGTHVMVGLLEASPWIAMTVLAGKRFAGRPRVLALFAAPALGLAIELAMLGHLKGTFALGWPYVVPRYPLYLAPVLVCIAGGHLARLRPKPWHFALCGALTIGLLAWLLPVVEDTSWWRRFFMLRVTLVLGAAVIVIGWLAGRSSPRLREASTILAMLAVACGIGVTVGVDDVEGVRQLAYLSGRMERFAAIAPARFALAGWGPDSDPVLALRGERDIHYIDFVETDNWDGFRKIMDKWNDDGRPIYGVFPRTPGAFQWPYADWDVPAELVDPQEQYWRIGPPRRRFDGPIPDSVPPPKPADAPPPSP